MNCKSQELCVRIHQVGCKPIPGGLCSISLKKEVVELLGRVSIHHQIHDVTSSHDIIPWLMISLSTLKGHVANKHTDGAKSLLGSVNTGGQGRVPLRGLIHPYLEMLPVF